MLTGCTISLVRYFLFSCCFLVLIGYILVPSPHFRPLVLLYRPQPLSSGPPAALWSIGVILWPTGRIMVHRGYIMVHRGYIVHRPHYGPQGVYDGPQGVYYGTQAALWSTGVRLWSTGVIILSGGRIIDHRWYIKVHRAQHCRKGSYYCSHEIA